MMETVVELRLTALDPLAITEGSAEGMGHETLHFIPGSMLLGAGAFLWKGAHPGVDPDADPEFVSLFLEGGARWGDAEPEVGGRACVPVPRCFMKVKNFDGLPVAGGGTSERAAVFNMLAADDGTRLGAEIGKLFPDDAKARAVGDAPKTKKIVGHMDPKTFRMPDIKETWSMHVALKDRRSETGHLFGYSAMRAGTTFRAGVVCRDEATADRVAALFKGAPRLRVGRSRSAGYGRVKVEVARRRSVEAWSSVDGSADLFLLSDYVPRHSWEAPMEGLERELRETVHPSAVIVDGKSFCAFETVAGFNGMWRLPKRSRSAILRGSVIRVKFDGTASLPSVLGGRRHEGYGRILWNPAFLQDLVVRPGDDPQEARAPEKGVGAPSPVLRLVRGRTVVRRAQEDAVSCVGLERIGAFLKDVALDPKPSQSQLGNIRTMVTHRPEGKWVPCFEAMLDKEPVKAQWTTVRATSPVGECRRETLDVIMKQLLGAEFNTKVIPLLPDLSLPGGDPSPAERKAYMEQLHRLALLELVSAWEKMRRRIIGDRRNG